MWQHILPSNKICVHIYLYINWERIWEYHIDELPWKVLMINVMFCYIFQTKQQLFVICSGRTVCYMLRNDWYVIFSWITVCYMFRNYCLLYVQELLFVICSGITVCYMFINYCLFYVQEWLFVICSGLIVCFMFRTPVWEHHDHNAASNL